MASIFDVEPPRWLQAISQPIDTKLAGQTLATALGGALGASQRQAEQGGSWFSNFLGAAGEAKLSLIDPFWKLKAQQLQLKTAGDVLSMIQQEQAITMNRSTMANMAADLDTIPKWLREHPTVESRMNAEWPTALSPQWNQNLDHLRLRDSQSAQSRTAAAIAHSFASRVDAVAKVDRAAAAPFVAITGVPTPEQLNALADTEKAVADKREADRQTAIAAARALGYVPEIRIGPSGETDVFKPPKVPTLKGPTPADLRQLAKYYHDLSVDPLLLRAPGGEKKAAEYAAKAADYNAQLEALVRQGRTPLSGGGASVLPPPKIPDFRVDPDTGLLRSTGTNAPPAQP